MTLPRDAAGRLLLPQPFPAAGRLFGALFMLPALKLGWDVISGAIADGGVTVGLSDVPGLLLWLFMMAVFLVPGWIIATVRRTVAIDRVARSVEQVNDFLIYRWRSHRSLSDFNAVRLFLPKRTSSSSSRTRATYHVALVGGGKREVLVHMEEDEDRAREVAREVAEFVRLPLRDDLLRPRRSPDDEHDEEDEDARVEQTGEEATTR